MKAIVGLGNPGPRYERTRHNLGFMVVDLLAKRHGLTFRSGKGAYLQTVNSDRSYGLFKPLSYMNNSGEPVSGILNWYKLEKEDLLVISDDLDLPFSTIRLKGEGSSGGHRGLDSIIRSLGDRKFHRLKIGIDSEDRGFIPTESFVLSGFNSAEREVLPELLDRCADAVEMYLDRGLTAAMNSVNRRQNAKSDDNLQSEVTNE